jgi:hypothetical protein
MRPMSAHLARAALAPLVALVLAGCSAPQALAPEPTTKATRALPRADAPSAPRASGEPLDHRTALAAFEIVTSLRCTFGESSRFDFEGHERSTSSEVWAMTIDALDLPKGRARVVTDSSAVDASARTSAIGLHVAEESTSGNVFLTTVYAVATKEGAKVSFLAVRSSHLALPPGTGSNRSALERRPLASQLTGSCVPLGVR